MEKIDVNYAFTQVDCYGNYISPSSKLPEEKQAEVEGTVEEKRAEEKNARLSPFNRKLDETVQASYSEQKILDQIAINEQTPGYMPSYLPYVQASAGELNPEFAKHMVQAIEQAGAQIGMYGNQLQYLVNDAVQKITRDQKRSKKKKIGEEIIESSDGLELKIIYDIGPAVTMRLTEDVLGRFCIYHLDFGKRKEEKTSVIEFSGGKQVLVNDKKMKGAALYDAFLRADITMNLRIKKAALKRALEDFFIPRVECCQNWCKVQTTAGWNLERKTFYHSQNYFPKRSTKFPNLPIFDKNFEVAELTIERRENYFSTVNEISGWKNRLLITLFPFAAILASLLKKGGAPLKMCLNFVFIESFDMSKICGLLQIFDRNRLSPTRLDISQAEIKKLLENTQDEPLIIDARVTSDDTDYQREKYQKASSKIWKIITGYEGMTTGMENNNMAGCVILNSNRILSKHTINIFVDSEFWKDAGNYRMFLELKSFEAVMSEFVCFVQKNWDLVLQGIRKQRQITDERIIVFEVVFELLKSFWKEEGINFEDALKLPRQPLVNLFKNMECDEEEIVQIFVKIVREFIGKFYVCEKNGETEYRQRTIYFDDDYLWIPTDILGHFLRYGGIYPVKNELLLTLKREGSLITDSEGFSRKCSIVGKRFETYQLKRKVFNTIGHVDIVELGREKENNER